MCFGVNPEGMHGGWQVISHSLALESHDCDVHAWIVMIPLENHKKTIGEGNVLSVCYNNYYWHRDFMCINRAELV